MVKLLWKLTKCLLQKCCHDVPQKKDVLENIAPSRYETMFRLKYQFRIVIWKVPCILLKNTLSRGMKYAMDAYIANLEQ